MEAHPSAICVVGFKGKAQALGGRLRGPPKDGQGCGVSEVIRPMAHAWPQLCTVLAGVTLV